MEITLKIDSNLLTFEDLLALEDAQDGKRPFHSMAQIFIKFMVGRDGERLSHDAALEVLKPLSLDDINKLAEKFGEAVQESQKSAVPPAKSGS